MTPDELRTYWNSIREPLQQMLLESSKREPQAFKELVQLAALNFMIESYLETFKPQG